MALTGSQKAYLYARAGVARSGATRANYYAFRVVILLDDAAGNRPAVDVTAYVAYNGWSVSMNINDDVDTAAIDLLPTLPFIPAPRAQVRIGFGAADNLTFAGLAMVVQRTRRPGPDARWWWSLVCVDWLAIFDAHFVVADYPAQSVTTTILDVIARFTTGAGFLTDGVAAGLPSIAAQQFINERPSTVLRRLTNLVGGGFYIDADRRVHAWSAAVASPIQPSTPQPLTASLASLKQFRMTEDGSQQRTRVLVEGARTETLLGPPATTSSAVGIPVADVSMVHLPQTGVILPNIQPNWMRIGTQYALAGVIKNATPDPSKNAPTTSTTAPVLMSDGKITVADASAFPDSGWIQLNAQVVNYAKYGPSQPLLLTVGTAGQYGALQANEPTGASVVLLSTFEADAQTRYLNPAFPSIWQTRAPMRAQPLSTPVVLVALQQDVTTAAALATREGSDGFLEHLVQDGRYQSAGANARGQAELANFAAPLVTYEWETDDLNAEPGRLQVIDLPGVSTTVRITNVDLTPQTATTPPRRAVRATRVQPASVLDIWVDDPR